MVDRNQTNSSERNQMNSSRAKPNEQMYLHALILLGLLFCFRVLGQLLVAFFGVEFLPPMEVWMSGALPYQILLPLQLAVIALIGKICRDVTTHSGVFGIPNQRLGRFFLEGGSFYLFIMILRYAIRMWLHPDQRWLGGTLPIAFHFVLATFVLVLARYHLRKQETATSKANESFNQRVMLPLRLSAALGTVGFLYYQLSPHF